MTGTGGGKRVSVVFAQSHIIVGHQSSPVLGETNAVIGVKGERLPVNIQLPAVFVSLLTERRCCLFEH